MSTSTKVGGNWKSLSGVSAKVSGNWRTVNSAYVKVAGQWKQWFAAFITDNFNRSTSGSLGTSSSGATWTTQQGVWYANGGQAQSDTSASSYPLASVGFGLTNATTSASVSEGTGVAFWISSAGSWWAATSYNNSSSYSYSCNPYACCCGCTQYQTTQSCTTEYVMTSSTGCGCVSRCPPGSSSYYGDCGVGRCGSFPCYFVAKIIDCPSPCYGYLSVCVDSGYQCVSYSCGTCYQTCSGTSYNYYLRLLSSVSGTVSSVTGDISLGSQAAAIAVTTSGDTITAKAYSDTNLSSQIGSTLTYTPSSPTKGLSMGIIKAPSDSSQGSTVDNFSVGL